MKKKKEERCSRLTSDVCNVLPTEADRAIHRPEALITSGLCASALPTYSPNLCPVEQREIKEAQNVINENPFLLHEALGVLATQSRQKVD